MRVPFFDLLLHTVVVVFPFLVLPELAHNLVRRLLDRPCDLLHRHVPPFPLETQERDILPTLPHIHQGTAGEEIRRVEQDSRVFVLCHTSSQRQGGIGVLDLTETALRDVLRFTLRRLVSLGLAKIDVIGKDLR